MVMRTLAPASKGTKVSTKQPPGPRSVVRVENIEPEPSSTTSAAAMKGWRFAPRRSDWAADVVTLSLSRLSPRSYIFGSCLLETASRIARGGQAYLLVHCLCRTEVTTRAIRDELLKGQTD